MQTSGGKEIFCDSNQRCLFFSFVGQTNIMAINQNQFTKLVEIQKLFPSFRFLSNELSPSIIEINVLLSHLITYKFNYVRILRALISNILGAHKFQHMSCKYCSSPYFYSFQKSFNWTSLHSFIFLNSILQFFFLIHSYS